MLSKPGGEETGAAGKPGSECVVACLACAPAQSSNKLIRPRKGITMKEKTQAKQNTSRAQSQMSDVADKVMKNYEQTIKTGVKLQEEAAHYWTNVMNQAAAPHDWQKRFSTATAFANGLMPAAQKRMEE